MNTKTDPHAVTIYFRDHEISQTFDCPRWEVRAAKDDCVMFTSMTVKGAMDAINEVMDDLEYECDAPKMKEVGGLRQGALHAVFETDDAVGPLKFRATIYRADIEADCLWFTTIGRARDWAKERMAELA